MLRYYAASEGGNLVHETHSKPATKIVAGLIERLKQLPRAVQIGVPLALFALFIWPTIYSHNDEVVGLKGSYGITPMFNGEMTRDCISETQCTPIYARTRQLRLFGEKQYETWTYPGDASRWFGNRLTYSMDGGFRAIKGMTVTDDAIAFAPGASSRMMRVKAERSKSAPPLLTQEWYTFRKGNEVTEIASGSTFQVEEDSPQLRLVLQARGAREAETLYDEGLQLADLDDGVIYWQFEESPIARLQREQARAETLAEQAQRLRGSAEIPAQDTAPVDIELIALLSDAALAKLRSGDLHLMRGQRGWAISLSPVEVAE